jgi:hypothetical protein
MKNDAVKNPLAHHKFTHQVSNFNKTKFLQLIQVLFPSCQFALSSGKLENI